MRENTCCRSERGGGGKGRELPVCLCAVGVCVCTDTCRSPSLAAHIVESSLLVWAVLFLSTFSPFTLPLHLVPLSLRFSSLLYFSSSLSPPTMVQDFYRRGRRAALLTEVSCVDGVMDEWMRQSLAANES